MLEAKLEAMFLYELYGVNQDLITSTAICRILVSPSPTSST